MKQLLALCLLSALIVASCTNTKTEEEKKTHSEVDSLETQVWDGHDTGMAKYGKLRSMKLRAEQMLDSISKLPEKARQASAPLKARLDSLVADLADAKERMDEWMSSFNRDTFAKDVNNRIRYLTEEKLKIHRIKDDILRGLARADSLMKERF